jgi:hypothetical protein
MKASCRRQHDGHLDVSVVNAERERRLVVEALDDDRLISRHGGRVDPRGYGHTRSDRELGFVRDLNDVLLFTKLHAEAADARHARRAERLLRVRAGSR